MTVRHSSLASFDTPETRPLLQDTDRHDTVSYDPVRLYGSPGFPESVQEAIERIDEELSAAPVGSTSIASLHRLRDLSATSGYLPSSCVLPECPEVESDRPAFQGGYADVFRGKLIGFGTVAVKRLRVRDIRMTDERPHKAFFREAVVWKHLRHSNVIPFIGVYATPSEFNLISPWMANGDIISFLKANLDADWQNLVLDIVEGLSYIHGMELVHGDLKGANILINSRLEACLSDFGLTTALSASDAPLSTSSAVIAGSARWLAPELIYPRGDRRHTPSSDVYAFGVVLWEIITCRVPFDDIPRDETVMLRVSRGLRPCIHCLADFPSVGYGALRLFESCLKTDPSERPRMGDASVKEALFGTANLPHKITPTWAGRTWLVLPPVLGFAASLLLLATIPSFRLGACIIAGIFVLLGIRNALLSQFVVLTVYTSAPSTITSFYDGDIVVPSLHISATVMSTVILGVSFYLNFADIPPDWGPSESYVFSSRYLTGCSIALYAGLSAYHDANLVFALLKYRKGASIQSVYNIRPGTQLVVSVPPAVFPQDVRFVCELMGELEWMSYHEKSHHYFVQYKNDDDAEQALVDLVPQLETFTTLGQIRIQCRRRIKSQEPDISQAQERNEEEHAPWISLLWRMVVVF